MIELGKITSTSKYISLILRHKPEAVGIKIDKHGWANTADLIQAIKIDMQTLEYIVETDNKGRYEFNSDRSKIRARQGHSIDVDVELEEREPPAILYHGTAEKYISSIEKYGIIPKGRLYVHLSSDIETAENVGKRHGNPVVIQINTGEMYADGYKFYRSRNGVWLTKFVDSKYIGKNRRILSV